MSMELMVGAMKAKVGNPLRKLVLIKLADNANDKGECWPSYQHIADQCEMSKRSVINHIDALCESGFLKKEVRKGGQKGNHSNIYHIAVGGAGDSLGGAGDSLGSAGAAPLPSAGAAPRTSHSLEPVKEPLGGSPCGDTHDQELGSNPPSVAKQKTASKTSTPKKATQLPGDFMPTAQHQALAAEVGVSLDLEWAKFCDHHTARGTVFKDWHAALRNWIRNAVKFQNSGVSHANGRTTHGQRAEVDAAINNWQDTSWAADLIAGDETGGI